MAYKKSSKKPNKYSMYVNYFSGDFFVGNFPTKKQAKEHFEKNKSRYRDYRGEKYGFPYGTPIITKIDSKRGK